MEEIDINKLKQDLKNYYEAAYFTLGYGAALMDSFDLDNLSDEEIMVQCQVVLVNSKTNDK